jgi:hypothetical protein
MTQHSGRAGLHSRAAALPAALTAGFGNLAGGLVRVYHFLCAKYGLENMARGRLRVAAFPDLNDPFELLSVQLADRHDRRSFLATRRKAIAKWGLLCFSKTWTNPVLWSHYAERHMGLCLGFDVPDNLGQDVTYLKRRADLDSFLPSATKALSRPGRIFFVKFKGWEYEKEWRRVVRLDEALQQDGLHFWPFGADLQLREGLGTPSEIAREL